MATAVILSGGRGTRLAPLTDVLPKPVLPFMSQPMVSYAIRALVKAGVKHVIMAVAYRADDMVEPIEKLASELQIQISFSREENSLGTAGPLILLKGQLSKLTSAFYVINADIMADYPFEELLQKHYKTGAVATIVTTAVEDPSRFGVVKVDRVSSMVLGFFEKPATYVGNGINAGLYLFNPSVFNYLPKTPRQYSMETGLFPILAKEQQLYALEMTGRWMDIGTWADYLRATNIWHPDNSDVWKEEGAKVSPQASLQNCVVLAGARIDAEAQVQYAIVGWDAHIGPGESVVGTDQKPLVKM